jgi:hypothetical protein
MKLHTWTVTCLYRSSSLTNAARELNLVSVQEDTWDNVGTVRAEDFNFLWKRKRISSIGNRNVCAHRIVSAAKNLLAIGCRV